MNSKEILYRAKEYIAAEKNDFFRKQVEEIITQNNLDELNDRFYTDLMFGTGGLRGIIGGGFNRMNSFTVQRATQGLVNYILKKQSPENAAVVIAYDSRNFSDLFSLEAAKVICGAGIKTYLFTGLRPTPELSFGVRYLKATAGIVITASHNPPAYNGYKVYWSDGGQIVPPHDSAIIEEVNSVSNITCISKEEALAKNLLIMIDKEVDDTYIEMIKAQSIRPELVKEKGKELKVVFTPLHGTGAIPVSRVLSENGIDVIFVKDQKKPDGNFPTVASPNPEEASALKMAIDLGEDVGADLILATDPDADRLGIAAPDMNNKFVLISGNQLGVLLADYIFSGKKDTATMPEKPAFIKTIVTTELQRRIAESYNAACFDVLTGFKYIGEKIKEFESNSEGLEYIFGGEESYGYLIGTEVRDKDAVSSAAMTAEMTLYYMSQGRTLLEQLSEIYKKYGYFKEILISKIFKGQTGAEKIKKLMNKLRNTPPETISGLPVDHIKDYIDGTVFNIKSGQRKKTINLPSSNVLQFILIDKSIISVRPSGTEPKIKFYASCCEKPDMELDKAKISVQKKIDAIKMEIETLIGG